MRNIKPEIKKIIDGYKKLNGVDIGFIEFTMQNPVEQQTIDKVKARIEMRKSFIEDLNHLMEL